MRKRQKLWQKQVKKYAVTIATNMAGRGTDIKLGESVLEPYDEKIVKELLRLKTKMISRRLYIIQRQYQLMLQVQQIQTLKK